MRGKRVRLSPPPFLRIRDYSLGYRVSVPYSPEMCLGSLQRFRDTTSHSYVVLTSESIPLCIHTPIGKQGVREGDAIRILPLP